MFRIAILDDDPRQAQSLAEKVRRHDRSREFDVTVAADPSELAAPLESGAVDILLVDISLSPDGPDGIQFVREFCPDRSGTQVIYVTGFSEFHTRVYRTPHVSFLTKPVDQLDLDEAIDRAIEASAARRSAPLRIHTREEEHVVLPDDIVFVESDRRLLNVHTVNGSFQTYAKLADVLAKLPSNFIQCHKSFVVNMDHITDFTTASLKVRTGETLPVSKSRHKDVRNAFFGYVRPFD